MAQHLEESDVRAWFEDYLTDFAALGRGEARPDAVAAHYRVPLVVTTDDVVLDFGSREEVVGWLTAQAEAMSAAGYDHTEVSGTQVRVANATTATVSASMVRRGADGSTLGEMTVTYVVVTEGDRPRVQVLAVRAG